MQPLDLGVDSRVYLLTMALHISDIARRTGVSSDAVRFYEKEGLLPPAPRSPSGYREYDGSTAERIRFIKGAQEMGLRLAEIAELLEIQDRGACPCGHTKALVESHLEAIDAELKRLSGLRKDLAAMARLECPTTTESELWPCQVRFAQGREVTDDQKV
jgi:DNA-binding transcriptional MerR regulator